MKKALQKIQNINNDITVNDAEAIINRTKTSKKLANCINKEQLAKELTSACTKYFMHGLNDAACTSKQKISALKGADQAIGGLLKKLSIFEDFNEQEQKFLMSFNPVFMQMESAAAHLDVRDDSDPYGNFVLSTYKKIHQLKKISEFALECVKQQHLVKEKKEKKETISADAWLIGKELPLIYEKHFEEFGVSSSQSNSKGKYGPGIRFIQACYLVFFKRNITGDAIDKAYKRYNEKRFNTLKQAIAKPLKTKGQHK